MEPLQLFFLWVSTIRPSILGQLFEIEFFPKWLDTLYTWLTQPNPSFEEIVQWYSFWKGHFPEVIVNTVGAQVGFSDGLKLMNKAIELGPDRVTKLPRPERKRSSESSANSAAAKAKEASRLRPSRAQEITFRSIVEEYISEHSLFFMPAGQVEEKSRLPFFRISRTVEGKGGFLVYLLDDAVWAKDVSGGSDEYRPCSLKDIVLRATKGHG